MPLYFFDITDDDTVLIDRVGTRCTDKVAAQIEAARALGSMARDALVDDSGDREMSIAVRDAKGLALARVHLQFTVKLEN